MARDGAAQKPAEHKPADQRPAGEAVLAVLADLRYWSDRGVRIVAVEPGRDDGVRVGVTSHPTTAEQVLRGHYSFDVTCWSSS